MLGGPPTAHYAHHKVHDPTSEVNNNEGHSKPWLLNEPESESNLMLMLQR